MNKKRNELKNSEVFKKEIKVSVRDIIEFILRSGDLDSSFTGSSRAVAGSRAHQTVQKRRDQENYHSEVMLSHTIERENYTLIIGGRADGIINREDQKEVIIEEIKSTTRELKNIDEDYSQLHWGQVIVYAYFYARKNSQEKISVQLTYVQLESKKEKHFKRNYTFNELENFFTDILDRYLYWSDLNYKWKKKRDVTIERLPFPFPAYRKGQRKLAVSVYKTIHDNKNLYCQAPTGIGKTISTIYPSIKAIGEGLVEKIFYLTAKTVTRKVVEENLTRLYEKDLELKVITLTAKDKICFQSERDCNPLSCPYARGHYDRVNGAIKAILEKEDLMSREIVENYARQRQICPFEFSLDLTLWSDLVICDYNYVFDPRVGLKRFFADQGGDFIFLIDEAHNLVDRARDMYSAEMILSDFISLKEIILQNNGNKDRALSSLLSHIKRVTSLLKGVNFHFNKKGELVQKEEPLEYYPPLQGFVSKAEEWLVQYNGLLNKDKDELYDQVLEQYFNVLTFLRIIDLYDEHFIVYYQQCIKEREKEGDQEPDINAEDKYSKNKEIKIKIFCLDPSTQLRSILKKGKAAIFFSATLSPLFYHRQILGGKDSDYLLELDSPFSDDNLSLLISPAISTKYREREKGYGLILEYIKYITDIKKGNYLVFFPSYAYMESVYSLFKNKYPEVNTMIQQPGLTEKERLQFLEQFNIEKEEIVGFAVLGGIFSEGIDLKGDRLLGTIVVGVGHPMICLERNLIRQYFQKENGSGYEYAYLYPGINKVLQAAGRTIRTEKDRGLILLIGERFTNYRYSKMLPHYWNKIQKIVKSPEEMYKDLTDFWNI